MIFAIYRGKEGVEAPGAFTKGRLYVAHPEVDDSAAVGYEKMTVEDDRGETVWIEVENGLFRYPQEVFAVMTRELGSRMPGEVVVIDGADEDGFLSVQGMGFIRPENVQLLDSTLVRPGMMVYDRQRMLWDRVRRVDERMRIQVEACDEMKECGDFIFSISDGDLATVPLLRCLDASGVKGLKEGSVYRVDGLDDDGLLIVEDDDGNEVSFEPDRFEFV